MDWAVPFRTVCVAPQPPGRFEASMSTFDPKELKILSDILALVLEDQPGQSATALEAIKNRARRNNMTGGALKTCFRP